MKRTFKEFGLDQKYLTVEMRKDLAQHLNKLPPNSGLAGTPAPAVVFGYNTPPGAYQIENGGAYIVAGQIGPGGVSSGWSGQGALAPTVDIVVGRNASARAGEGPPEGGMVENNFASDAARIYISRMTDLDTCFGLAQKDSASTGKKTSRSGVGIKADNVALIGREGVKIVTGGSAGAKFGMSGETNSLGGSIMSRAPKIELIAGNVYQGVSGVAKGDATRDSLRELHDIVQDLLGAVYNFITLQTSWDGVLGVTPLPHHAAGAAPKNMGNLTMVMSTLYSTRLNLMLWHFNTLSPYGGAYIVSRNVRTN